MTYYSVLQLICYPWSLLFLPLWSRGRQPDWASSPGVHLTTKNYPNHANLGEITGQALFWDSLQGGLVSRS